MVQPHGSGHQPGGEKARRQHHHPGAEQCQSVGAGARKVRDKGIVVLTHGSIDPQIGQWDRQREVRAGQRKDMGDKGGYAIYVDSLTVPLHNAWADSTINYQKAKYPKMFEVTSRLPVASRSSNCSPLAVPSCASACSA